MVQVYILDTNVLLSDPKSLFYFEEHDVVIPVQCIEELDKFKKERLSARGAAARTVSRYLDKLRSRGSLMTGVPLEGGGSLRVDFSPGSTSDGGLGKVDDSIIALAKSLSDRGDDVTLISRDTNMRIKADVLGVRAEDYRHDALTVPEEDGFRGFINRDASPLEMDTLYANERILVEPKGLLPRQFVVLKDPSNRSALCIANDYGDALNLINSKINVWGIAPRSKEQCFALRALLDPEIPLVSLSGRAGTGKTLVALAAALQNTCEDNLYRKVLVARPMISMGKEVGYLPGSLEDKLKPWMQPIFDNLEVLVGASDGAPKYSYLLDREILQVEALSFIRGRSIPHQYMIIDEAQNLTPHEAKTILTRAGEGTKIVLTGDPMQIDNPYVDHRSNGLSYVVEAFKSSPLAAHITLTKGERSALADEAARLL